jgi:quercetin dioxygenase-like cupin family protein
MQGDLAFMHGQPTRNFSTAQTTGAVNSHPFGACLDSAQHGLFHRPAISYTAFHLVGNAPCDQHGVEFRLLHFLYIQLDLFPNQFAQDAACLVNSLPAAANYFETGTAASGQLTFSPLAAGKNARHMEPFMIDVRPGAEHSLSAHEGEEFIHVLAGAIEVEYGKEMYSLGAGDSIYYDSIVPHQVRAAAGAPAQILAVVFSPV